MLKLAIKDVAERQGLNQTKLIEKSGVSPQLMNRYWNNHIQSVAFEPLEKIAKALGVKPGDLIVPTEDSKHDVSASA